MVGISRTWARAIPRGTSLSLGAVLAHTLVTVNDLRLSFAIPSYLFFVHCCKHIYPAVVKHCINLCSGTVQNAAAYVLILHPFLPYHLPPAPPFFFPVNLFAMPSYRPSNRTGTMVSMCSKECPMRICLS